MLTKRKQNKIKKMGKNQDAGHCLVLCFTLGYVTGIVSRLIGLTVEKYSLLQAKKKQQSQPCGALKDVTQSLGFALQPIFTSSFMHVRVQGKEMSHVCLLQQNQLGYKPYVFLVGISKHSTSHRLKMPRNVKDLNWQYLLAMKAKIKMIYIPILFLLGAFPIQK